jgi:formylglycine-generating enzyme required for sulfatase activity
MAWLVDAPGGRLTLRNDRPTRLGRAADNDLVLTDSTVSQHHAVISFDDGRAYLRDLGSSNGTFIGGMRVSGGQLADGSVIKLGRVVFVYRESEGAQSAGPLVSPPQGPARTSGVVKRGRASHRTSFSARTGAILGALFLLGLLATLGGRAFFDSLGSPKPNTSRLSAARLQTQPADSEHPTKGRTFRDCQECPEMVVVPAGSFTMGDDLEGPQLDDLEGPRHQVTIGQPLAVGKYPVTRDEYTRFVEATGHSDDEWKKQEFPQTGRDPVVNVSWDDAKAYVGWLSEKAGHTYRLLSEAEYEYAERAGTSTVYWWGNSDADLCKYANGDCNHHGTVPVGSYPANAFGLYDVAGNVWEWTEDCWNHTYARAPDDGTAWTTGSCGERVLRGGSFYMSAEELRSAVRYRQRDRQSDYGFRVARTLYAPPEPSAVSSHDGGSKPSIGGLSDADFDSRFQCPESLSSDAQREAVFSEYMDWVAVKHSHWEVSRIIDYRVELLTRHHCANTLRNVGVDNPPKSNEACKDSVGQVRADTYVTQCLEVGPGTHPPCNSVNPCQMIIDEIIWGCGRLYPYYPSTTIKAPEFCREYANPPNY